jgi:hypothetical protein
MNISSSKPIKPGRSSPAGRAVLAALLCAFGAAAFALAIFAGDAQAQVGIQAKTNFVINGSFEIGGSPPASWGGVSLTSADKRVCNKSYAGDCSFKFVGDNTYKYLYQCIDFTNTDAGNEFKFKAWTKGKNLAGGAATFYVEFYNAGSSVNYEYVNIPSGTYPWAWHKVSATADADYDEICMWLVSQDAGKLWVDKVSLVYVGGP